MSKLAAEVMREYIASVTNAGAGEQTMWALSGTTDIHHVLANVSGMMITVAAKLDEHSKTIEALQKRVDALECCASAQNSTHTRARRPRKQAANKRRNEQGEAKQ